MQREGVNRFIKSGTGCSLKYVFPQRRKEKKEDPEFIDSLGAFGPLGGILVLCPKLRRVSQNRLWTMY